MVTKLWQDTEPFQVDTWRFPVLLPADMQLWEAGGVFQYALASEKLLG